MIWTKINKLEDFEQIHQAATIIKYKAAIGRDAPAILTGETYGDSYTVKEIEGNRISIQLVPRGDSIQKMMESIFPTTMDKSDLINQEVWYYRSDEEMPVFGG